MLSLNRALVLSLVLAAAASVAAAPVVIRLSTVAPAGTTWDAALKDMGATWNKATEGRVTLRVTGGGAQGSEGTVLKNMRPEVNTVDAWRTSTTPSTSLRFRSSSSPTTRSSSCATSWNPCSRNTSKPRRFIS